MFIQRSLLSFLLFFGTVAAHAEGSLSVSFQNLDGFNKMIINENGVTKEGIWYTGGGNYPIRTYMDGEVFHIDTGATQDFLNITKYPKKTRFVGRLNGAGPFSTLESSVDAKGKIRITGIMAEKTKFEAHADPVKGNFVLFWDDYALELNRNPAKGPGACIGYLQYGMKELGKILCQSSGSMEDAFFKNEHDIIAWMIHKYVTVPDDDGGDDDDGGGSKK